MRFAEGPCRAAARVLLLGDLFDVWVSPAQAELPAYGRVLDTLRRLATGIEVGFVEGNRDFAATPVLREAGVRPLPDVVVLESSGRRVVATHGDLLCRRDVRYQAYRRIVRTGVVRTLLGGATGALTAGVAGAARAGSRLETARKAYGDMGLDPRAVAAMLHARDADALVCGHVHWGRRYRMDVGGLARDVVVLSAWEDGPTYASLDSGRLDFRSFTR